MKRGSNKFILVVKGLAVITVSLVFMTGCASLQEMLKPTSIEQKNYVPTAKPEWKDKTIFIDFDTGYHLWYYDFASDLSENIRDTLIEDVVEDQIFHVQDHATSGVKYLYRIGVKIADPVIKVDSAGVIQSISASFRIKTYDSDNNLVTAKTREIRYDAPAITIATNDSQQKLLATYTHNAAQEIRQIAYESLK